MSDQQTRDECSVLGECSICFEDMKPRGTANLECGHIFHGKCVRRAPNKKCPLCRHAIKILKREKKPAKPRKVKPKPKTIRMAKRKPFPIDGVLWEFYIEENWWS